MKFYRDKNFVLEKKTDRSKVGIYCGDYCPVCSSKLKKRKKGLVCKNWHCPIYWKYYGWTWIKEDEA